MDGRVIISSSSLSQSLPTTLLFPVYWRPSFQPFYRLGWRVEQPLCRGTLVTWTRMQLVSEKREYIWHRENALDKAEGGHCTLLIGLRHSVSNSVP